ncbi:MAG: chaplin family protein, partial [Aeromicrobium sp.]
MRTSVRRALCATAMAGGFTVLGIAYATSSASAADNPDTTSGDSGLVSGNQTGTQIAAPVRVAGNQVTVGGDGNSSTHSSPSGGGGGTAGGSDSGGQSTSGNDGTASGNQTDAAVDAPVDAADNQVTVLGDGNDNTGSGSGGGAAGSSRSGGATTSGDDGTGSGNQTGADATAPVDASGNQVTVLGDDNTAQARRPDGAAPTAATGQDETDGTDGTASGNQTVLGLAAPVDVTGNQVTVLGD